jgi:hypothetical protein
MTLSRACVVQVDRYVEITQENVEKNLIDKNKVGGKNNNKLFLKKNTPQNIAVPFPPQSPSNRRIFIDKCSLLKPLKSFFSLAEH